MWLGLVGCGWCDYIKGNVDWIVGDGYVFDVFGFLCGCEDFVVVVFDMV